jgi:hypothetical protein
MIRRPGTVVFVRYIRVDVCRHVCIYVGMYASMCVYTYVCLHVACMYVRMYAAEYKLTVPMLQLICRFSTCEVGIVCVCIVR